MLLARKTPGVLLLIRCNPNILATFLKIRERGRLGADDVEAPPCAVRQMAESPLGVQEKAATQNEALLQQTPFPQLYVLRKQTSRKSEVVKFSSPHHQFAFLFLQEVIVEIHQKFATNFS